MTVKEYFSFRQGKYFWLNILAMGAVVCVLLFGTLRWLDSYTRHGEAVAVPNVEGISVDEAEALFTKHGLRCMVSDSTYVKELPAGCVLDCTPQPGQKVKEGRIVYLTINTMSIPLHPVPDVADNSSLRQAEARILAAGFRLDSIEYMMGEKDWVYGVKYNNRELEMGEKVPTGATLTLLVGDGGEMMLDSLSVDSLQITALQPVELKQEPSATDESWF